MLATFVLASDQSAAQTAPVPVKPLASRVLCTANQDAVQRYLAFPALLDLGDEIVISFKRGRSHAGDANAVLDQLKIQKNGRQVQVPKTIAHQNNQIMQMGEWVQFPDGVIANYIDVQQIKDSARVGLHVVRSRDQGKTFEPLERVGQIDGVEYGYAFDFINQGRSTWVLAMTFSNLPGGKSVYPARPHAGSVDVLRSDDSGASWNFVRNLTEEFGLLPLNESAFIRTEDGFLITTRGYDQHQRLHLTDAQFRLQKQVDLTESNVSVQKHIGRPRLFQRDNRFFLLGRNYTTPDGPMQLSLIQIDPNSLAVKSHLILDNAEGGNVTDGYYACLLYTSPSPRDRG